MAVADRHPEEARRLEALAGYDVLGTPAESDFDEIAALAARLCETPIALISFVGATGQWFKSHIGIDVEGTDLARSVCAHAILGRETLEIPDTTEDPRTRDNPLVTGEVGMRSYTGVPLATASGPPLGTLCVIDRRPRRLRPDQLSALEVLARQVVTQLELRRVLRREAETADRAEAQSAELQRLLDTAETLRLEIDHRVKNSLQLVSSLLAMQGARTESREVREALTVARGRVLAISSIHAALNVSPDAARVNFRTYAERLVEDLGGGAPSGVRIVLDADDVELDTSQASSLAILVNEFVTNSLKHAFPDGRGGTVTLEVRDEGTRVSATFRDDGVGHAVARGRPLREGLGTRIMLAVGEQLGARLDFLADVTGTSLRFDFPIALR